MGPPERLGLDLLVKLGHRQQEFTLEYNRQNIQAAIRWINLQLAIDAKRRVKRGKYKRSSR